MSAFPSQAQLDKILRFGELKSDRFAIAPANGGPARFRIVGVAVDGLISSEIRVLYRRRGGLRPQISRLRSFLRDDGFAVSAKESGLERCLA